MNLTDLYDAILNGKLDRAVAVTNEAISEGVLPNEIITNYMIKAMEEIGNRFEAGKVFVPNLLMSARAMKGALDLLKPLLQGETDAYVGKIVIGTVKGDLHDIGKNLVASMFEGCGFEVVNLGVDVSSEKFVEAARTNNADIICMSALLTTTGEFYQFNLSSCIRQQNSLTAQFVSFSLSNLANIFYPPPIFTIINLCLL
ncbi:corrinoid protein [Bacteroides fragilis]|uniref:corrinoid protein n=1 Tax=Bacteroides fragilis TaxID=817 RepID=UPI0004BCA41A|nr:corrinoid protein [Bacteroides fragilis]